MKITMLTTSFPLYEGHSSGTFIFDIAAGLVERGHQVSVLAPHAPGGLCKESMRGIDVRRFRYAFPERHERLAYGGGIPGALGSDPSAKWLVPSFATGLLASAIRICRDADVIHAHWAASGLFGVIVGGLSRTPVVVTTHGTDINGLPDRGPRVMLTRWVLRRANRVVCVSNSLADRVAELGVSVGKVQVIHNGVDSDLFCPARDSRPGRRLIYVGRLTPEKGVEYLIRALAVLQQGTPDVHLKIVGDGPDRPRLEQQTRDLGVADAVTFTGPKPHEQIPDLMRQSDLLVLPSLSEGFGIVLIEAMATGLPVIATETGGIPEIVRHGENGLLVQARDAQGLAASIETLFGDHRRCRRLAEHGMQIARERFTIENQIRRYERVYAQCIGPSSTAAEPVLPPVASTAERKGGDRAERGSVPAASGGVTETCASHSQASAQ
ncbi:MAG: glycosyltransferase [Armatimonadia bacterium]|nr:glycosyltransferase [Armatimonadia bacterium]